MQSCPLFNGIRRSTKGLSTLLGTNINDDLLPEANEALKFIAVFVFIS